MLSKTHGCKLYRLKTIEVVILELHEMQAAPIVAIGSKSSGRIMDYHMDIFKNVDILVAPTTWAKRF
ncbi:hypothetical protein FRX31_015237 [Thalictrum thalictroides]|uniref:Uncharacterized protein n=1 Tax=Thalictrum thalictroides TaxID=46969 RepID=A0A7J6WCK8_THATH|nr:hypothetical protein FRX31_015237 [Thalictrum thalictroides]